MKLTRISKIVVCIFIIFGLCSCSLKETKEIQKKQETVKDNENKDFVDPYLDENPIELGLYLNTNGTRNLITTFESPFTIYQDIVSLEVYYTHENSFTGNQKNLWNQYYSNYTNVDNYKIGYHLSFQVGEQKMETTILKPSDAANIVEYVQVYLYDDIHQENGWYDHITEEEVTDETRLTSIKLTASNQIAAITSPIIVTAFTYDEDDFDEFGEYRGKSSFQVSINRK